MNIMKILTLFFLYCSFGIVIVLTKHAWWKNTIIYEIYIRSFKDSNGDGVGDLKGITSELDHFKDINVDTIWITPFLKSPMVDLGYDISDYFKIDPLFGIMDDFNELMREMKKRGLKLIMDLVINHTSDEHPWFENSVLRKKPYTDYYIWKDPKGYDKNGKPIPPNNWLSLFSSSAWQWNQKRKQFYYHKFEPQQPDLNLRNPSVKKEIEKIIKFWLDKGVSGFRLDAARNFMEDTMLRDEPLKSPNNDHYYAAAAAAADDSSDDDSSDDDSSDDDSSDDDSSDDDSSDDDDDDDDDDDNNKNNKNNNTVITYTDLLHIYTDDQWDTYKFIHELREFIDLRYGSKNDEKILIPESWANLTNQMMYYGNESYKIAHFPFNLDIIKLREYPNPMMLDGLITSWLTKIPSVGVANWLTENHDTYRIGSKLNAEFMDIFLFIIMMLPGVACIYYGQEIGMINTKLKPDPVIYTIREQQVLTRHPMQWNNYVNAGFTRNKKPWLPVNSDYWQVNVETQKKDHNSRYNLFKILSALRREETLKYGEFKSYILSSQSYAFSRFRNTTSKCEMRIIVVMNLSFESDEVNLHKHIPDLPQSGKILTTSLNIRKDAPVSKLLPLEFKMRPVSAIVLGLDELWCP